MLTTRFLSESEYAQYGDWMKSRDQEARNLYFGYNASDENIDSLIERVLANPDDNYFLVAETVNGWIGTIHIAITGSEVEFGLMVTKECRGQGIASQMMDEALVWARNRGYRELFMHCLSYNQPVKRLCHKYGLETSNMLGESETKVTLPPPNMLTYTKEAAIRNKQMWRMMLRNTWPGIEIYG